MNEYEQWIMSIRETYGATKVVTFGTIYGNLPRLENNREPKRRIKTGINKAGKPYTKKWLAFEKSPEAKQYQKNADIYLLEFVQSMRKRGIKTPFDQPVAVWLRVWLRTPITLPGGQDLAPGLFYNCLQSAGILEDDRLIAEEHNVRRYDKENPRVDFYIAQPSQEVG